MAKLISKTYGDALLEFAVEENKIDLFCEEIEGIQTALKDNPDFSRLLINPRIAMDEKITVVKNVFTKRVSEEIVGFLVLIVTKGRYSKTNEILQYFLDRVKELKGIGVAYVTTPTPLNDAQKKNVESKILKTTDFNKMEMHYFEDENLIGGMQIRIGDRVVDSSVHTKILKMQQELLKIQL